MASNKKWILLASAAVLAILVTALAIWGTHQGSVGLSGVNIPSHVDGTVGAAGEPNDPIQDSGSASKSSPADYTINESKADELVTKEPPVKLNGKEYTTPTDEEIASIAEELKLEMDGITTFGDNSQQIEEVTDTEALKQADDYLTVEISINGFTQLAEINKSPEKSNEQLQICLESLDRAYDKLERHTSRVRSTGNNDLIKKWNTVVKSLDLQMIQLADIKDIESLGKSMGNIKYLELNAMIGEFSRAARAVYTADISEDTMVEEATGNESTSNED